MLSRRGANILFVVLMAGVMSFVMSFVMTLANTRLDSGFWDRWLRAFVLGYVVALPTAMVVVPLVRRFTDRLAR
jgi:hypothetical protein